MLGACGPSKPAGSGDPSPMAVQTVAPPADSTADDISVVEVTFNGKVADDTSAPLQDWVTVGADGVPVAGTVTRGENTLTFTPNTSFPLRGVVDVVVSGEVESEDNELLGADFSYSFNIRDGAWHPPLLVRDTSGNTVATRIAWIGEDRLLAVWAQFESVSTERGMLASEWTLAAGWSEPVNIESGSNPLAFLQLIPTPDGALAVWRESVGPEGNLFARSFSSTTGWSGTATPIESAGSTRNFAAATNAAGDVAIAFELDEGAGIYDIWGRQLVDGVWGVATPIAETVGVTESTPHVALDDAGDVTVVYHSGSQLMAARWEAGSAPDAATLLGAFTGGGAALAGAPNGDVLVAWPQSAAMRSRLFSAGAWLPEALLDSNQGLTFRTPFPLICPDGNAIVAWTINDIGGDVRAASRIDGAWDPAVSVLAVDTDAFVGDVECDDTSRAYLVGTHGDTSGPDIEVFATTWGAAGGWQVEEQVVGIAADGIFTTPTVAVHRRRRSAAVTWIQGTTANLTPAEARFE